MAWHHVACEIKLVHDASLLCSSFQPNFLLSTLSNLIYCPWDSLCAVCYLFLPAHLLSDQASGLRGATLCLGSRLSSRPKPPLPYSTRLAMTLCLRLTFACCIAVLVLELFGLHSGHGILLGSYPAWLCSPWQTQEAPESLFHTGQTCMDLMKHLGRPNQNKNLYIP